MRVCVVGSTNVDLVLDVAQLPAPGETTLARGHRREGGGKGANQACALARLGADALLVSAVGDDTDGHRSLELLTAAGVDVSGVAVRADAATGLAVVTVDAAGENCIVVSPGANALVAPPRSYDDVDAVLLSLEVPVPVVVDAALAARAARVPVVLNAAPARPLPEELLQAIDVLVVNEVELAGLGGRAAALLDRGPGSVVVTRGAAGCLVVDRTGETVVPAAPAEVVDTTGAGDCFAAALTYGLAAGWALPRSARLATAAAGLSVTRAGARGGLPTLAEAETAH